MKFPILLAFVACIQVVVAQHLTKGIYVVNEKSCNCSKKQLDFFEGFASAPVVFSGTVHQLDTVVVEVNTLNGPLFYERIQAQVEVHNSFKGAVMETEVRLLNKVETSGMQLKIGKTYVLFAAISSLAALDSQYYSAFETSKEMGSCLANYAKLSMMEKIACGYTEFGSIGACIYNRKGSTNYLYSRETDSIYQYKHWPHDTLVQKLAVFGRYEFSDIWHFDTDSIQMQYGQFRPLNPKETGTDYYLVIKTGRWHYYDLQNDFWMTQDHGTAELPPTTTTTPVPSQRKGLRALFDRR